VGEWVGVSECGSVGPTLHEGADRLSMEQGLVREGCGLLVDVRRPVLRGWVTLLLFESKQKRKENGKEVEREWLSVGRRRTGQDNAQETIDRG
jgi:hypothetical protein